MTQQHLTLPDALSIAVKHHQTGSLDKARAIYEQILVYESSNADALHLLGVLLGQQGDSNAAYRWISQAVAVRPQFVEAYRNLGNICADLKRMDESIGCYRRATELNAADPLNWFSYGISLRMGGRWDDAITAFERTVKLDPKNAEAYFELGGLLCNRGRAVSGMAAILHGVKLRPDSADSYSNLAVAFTALEKLEEAVSAFSKAIHISPTVAKHRVSLGDLYVRMSQFSRGLKLFTEAIEIDPRCVAAYASRGMLHAEMEEFELAISDHHTSIAIAPEDPVALIAMSKTLRLMGQLDDAEICAKRATEVDPRSGSAWEALGRVLQTRGDFAQAIQCFRTSLAIYENPAVYMLMSTIAQQVEKSEELKLRQILEQSDIAESHRVSAGFALGKILDQSDRFDEAFRQFSAANDLFKKVSLQQGFRFYSQDLHQTVDELLMLDMPFFQNRTNWGNASDLPVFIVGMPRSGTTLVEQIASSHSKVFGAGELQEISTYLAKSGHRELAKWEKLDVARVAEDHHRRLVSLGQGAKRVIDKMPANIMNLGLIALLFPGARVIFCERNPLDNCLSCYFQRFGKNNLMWSYDIVDCATQYLEQKRLTAHWHKVLTLKMMTLQYENLVANVENESRRLIDFLGLDWEPACLDFHENERAVLTASLWQVRQPIYTGSVGRWKHYEKHLGPLQAALAQGVENE